MTKAYLQNKKAQYYYISDDGTIALSDQKKPLQYLPEMIEPAEDMVSIHEKYKDFTKTGFIFKADGWRILSHIFFKNGMEGDCVLTIEPENNICGDLDFSTARVVSSKKEIRICCVHF